MPGDASSAPAVHTPAERCPYCPGALIAPHNEVFAAPAPPASLPHLASSTLAMQHESQLAVLYRQREHHLRGPPFLTL
jgi:hypothetical protein